MKQTIIYFIRHGTIKNRNPKVIPGDYDFALNSKGKSEIQKAANWLSKKEVSAIYSSPIKRAFESAEIIQKKFLNLKIKNLLILGSGLGHGEEKHTKRLLKQKNGKYSLIIQQN